MSKKKAKGKGPSKACVDFMGKEFSSIKLMCQYYGINQRSFCSRIKSGMSLKQALLTPIGERGDGNVKLCRDHLGNEFDSIGKMCEHYGINQSSFCSRIRSGMSLEQALLKPTALCNAKPCKDHLGNEFDSIGNMLKFWGVNRNSYYAAIKRGKTLEEILAGSPKQAIPEKKTKSKTVLRSIKLYEIDKNDLEDVEVFPEQNSLEQEKPEVEPKTECISDSDKLNQAFFSIQKAIGQIKDVVKTQENLIPEPVVMTETELAFEKYCADNNLDKKAELDKALKLYLFSRECSRDVTVD